MMVVFGVLLVAGCGGGKADEATPVKTVADWIPLRVGPVELEVQVAIRPAEMQRGLMGRSDLGETQGMLFVHRAPQALSFWMRNTSLPLDIAYFSSDGTLREVYQLHPYDETPVQSMRSDLQYALEVKQGGLARLGIKVGDQLDMAALRSTVEARGFNLRQFAGLVE